MKSLGLVSCTKRKQDYPCKASEMYRRSNLFSKAYAYCEKNYDQVAILSAKYGLLLPDDPIKPYNVTLNDKGVKERKVWSEKVFEQMKDRLRLADYDKVFFQAIIDGGHSQGFVGLGAICLARMANQDDFDFV